MLPITVITMFQHISSLNTDAHIMSSHNGLRVQCCASYQHMFSITHHMPIAHCLMMVSIHDCLHMAVSPMSLAHSLTVSPSSSLLNTHTHACCILHGHINSHLVHWPQHAPLLSQRNHVSCLHTNTITALMLFPPHTTTSFTHAVFMLHFTQCISTLMGIFPP